MQGDVPSRTAVLVAFARAAATLERGAAGEGLDPDARGLLPAPMRALVDALAVAARVSPWTMRAVRAATLGMVDHCELRSLAIDEVTRAALTRHGSRQLVILGAGLDARARRLPEAAAVRVFEVDHPATQRYKRARWEGAAPLVHFVAVDFERDSLDARLHEAGHDVNAPTLWIWEGTTPYLPLDATRATLDVVRARAAPGSTLAVTYATPEMTNAPRALNPIARRILSLLGEPAHGLVPRARFASMLAEARFKLVGDTGVTDWVTRFQPPHPPRIKLTERLAIAVVE